MLSGMDRLQNNSYARLSIGHWNTSESASSAKKEGLIEFNPFAAVDGLKQKRLKKETFSPEQVSKMLAVVRDTDWEGAILLGYTTGMRQQDVTNLRWSSIDTENGVLSFVQRKTDAPALIGLHPDLQDWITRQIVPDDPEAYLFPMLANRRGSGRAGLCREFQEIMERAGVSAKILRTRTGKGITVRSLSFHSFRHGAATAVFKSAALRDIARRVTAHSSRGVVDRYIHEDVEAIRQATNLIPRLPKAE
jgi:integrase